MNDKAIEDAGREDAPGQAAASDLEGHTAAKERYGPDADQVSEVREALGLPALEAHMTFLEDFLSRTVGHDITKN